MAQINDTQMSDTFTKFVTDHNSVKNRLGLGANNGETSELGAIALLDKTLNTSLTIGATKRAIGVDTEIASGVTVTVASGGTFVVL
jgi:hypothetical protein